MDGGGCENPLKRGGSNFGFSDGRTGSGFPHMTFDFLVIGAGIAACRFALRAAKHGKIVVVTKGKARQSNTAGRRADRIGAAGSSAC